VRHGKPNPQASQPTRRDFARTLATLAAAPLAAGAGLAQDEPAKPQPPDPNAEIAKALAAIARVRYGKFLTDDQLKTIQRRLANSARSADRLGKIKLKNGDEPDFVFRAEVP
jgi:hypothetical protein